MSDLVRTEIGSFRLEDACELTDLTPQTLSKFLLPARRAVEHLPTIALSPAEFQYVVQGMYICRASIPAGTEFAAITANGELAAILTRDGERLRPSLNVSSIATRSKTIEQKETKGTKENKSETRSKWNRSP
jgi:tRNA U55 pseudouridine synthase TruB